MAKTAKFSLKLLIDEKRSKVVLAEADQDFVDVLFSLLTLPMGKVAKLLEHHKNLLGCYKNLNKSVADMSYEHFETEACKNMLLNPKSIKEIHCRRLKMNLGDTEPTTFFMCPNFSSTKDNSCSNVYSNFNTSRCCCGALMCKMISVREEDQVGEVIGSKEDGVFVNCRSSFIVTDDLKVTLNSIGAIMKVLSDQGYNGFGDLQETLLDVGFDQMVTLLGCLFTSETPLTCAFLKKPCSLEMLSKPVQKTGRVEPNSVCYVKGFVRKSDKQILYVECTEDFIDSLLSFLVFPLEMAYSLSNDANTILRCVGNLSRNSCRRASTSSFSELPYYYYCSKNLFGCFTRISRSYECLLTSSRWDTWKFGKKFEKSLLKQGEKVVTVFPNNPKVKPETSSSVCSTTGFLKKNTKFIVSNDLIITPMSSSSTIGLLKKMQIDFNDLEEHQIIVSKAELSSILRASLVSSSALTSALSNLLVKKPKEET